MGFLDKLGNSRTLKKLERTTNQVLELEETFKNKTEDELKSDIETLKKRFKNGESLEALLPETFAIVRESSSRVLNMKHYPVQVMGGIALNNGDVAEMATGEGKTLVATLPIVLNALTGNNVHVVTSNEYLAKRDAEQMSKLFNYLGFSTGVSLSGQSVLEKQEAYRCDITYTTNTELGFDYLRDNLATREESKVLRGLNYVIIDELDDTLIDEAKTPLVLSVSNNDIDFESLKKADLFAKSLTVNDIEIDSSTNTVILTEKGGKKADKFFEVENIYDMSEKNYIFYIRNALKANYLFEKEIEYVVDNGEVKIVNASTGRTMSGRRYSDGLHQAIEIKEGVEIKEETVSKSSITFQSFFKQYNKLSGMTGTAKTDDTELLQMYNLKVVQIPTNKEVQRTDEQTRVFLTEDAKVEAIITEVLERFERGQPVLIGTASVEKSEYFSNILSNLEVEHQVLNAKNHEKESQIIAQAGRKGTITIATNMAGRGTDISLGGNPTYLAKEDMLEIGFSQEQIAFADSTFECVNEEQEKTREIFETLKKEHKKITDQEKEEVLSLGGLRVIGTEMHESRRVDNQLRGRAGRQGDVGSTQFYVSLEDKIFSKNSSQDLDKIVGKLNLDPEKEIFDRKILNYVSKIQEVVESVAYASRKEMLAYDKVVDVQRKLVFEKREQLLKSVQNDQHIKSVIKIDMKRIVDHLTNWVGENKFDFDSLKDMLKGYKIDLKFLTLEFVLENESNLAEALAEKFFSYYESQRQIIEKKEPMIRNIERKMLIDQIDNSWAEQIKQMEFLKESVFLKVYSGVDPKIEYVREGHRMFEQLQEEIACETTDSLLKFMGAKVDKYNEMEQAVNSQREKLNQLKVTEETKFDKKPSVANKFPPEENFAK